MVSFETSRDPITLASQSFPLVQFDTAAAAAAGVAIGFQHALPEDCRTSATLEADLEPQGKRSKAIPRRFLSVDEHRSV